MDPAPNIDLPVSYPAPKVRSHLEGPHTKKDLNPYKT